MHRRSFILSYNHNSEVVLMSSMEFNSLTGIGHDTIFVKISRYVPCN